VTINIICYNRQKQSNMFSKLKYSFDQKIALAGLIIGIISIIPLLISFIGRFSINSLLDFFNLTFLIISQNKFLLFPIFFGILLGLIFTFKIKLNKYIRFFYVILLINITLTQVYLKSEKFIYFNYNHILELEKSKNIEKAFEYCFVTNTLNHNKLNRTKRRLNNKREVINSLRKQLKKCSPSIHGSACEEIRVMLNAISNEKK